MSHYLPTSFVQDFPAGPYLLACAGLFGLFVSYKIVKSIASRLKTRDFVKTYGKWGLVTGASAGIGIGFAEALAERGMNLVIVARRLEKLEELKAKLEEKYSISVLPFQCDLTKSNAPQDVFDFCSENVPEPIGLLVNNAGLGAIGNFLNIPSERNKAMIDLNIIALTELVRLFLKPMAKQNRGGIVNVSSLGAEHSLVYNIFYSSTKAFVTHFSRGLRGEIIKAGANIDVVCLEPGKVQTEFFAAAGGRNAEAFSQWAPGESTPRDNAEASIRGLFDKKAVVFSNRTSGIIAKIFRNIAPENFPTGQTEILMEGGEYMNKPFNLLLPKEE